MTQWELPRGLKTKDLSEIYVYTQYYVQLCINKSEVVGGI